MVVDSATATSGTAPQALGMTIKKSLVAEVLVLWVAAVCVFPSEARCQQQLLRGEGTPVHLSILELPYFPSVAVAYTLVLPSFPFLMPCGR